MLIAHFDVFISLFFFFFLLKEHIGICITKDNKLSINYIGCTSIRFD